jgi:hypothetical protein
VAGGSDVPSGRAWRVKCRIKKMEEDRMSIRGVNVKMNR